MGDGVWCVTLTERADGSWGLVCYRTEGDAMKQWRKHTWDNEGHYKGMEEAYLGQRGMVLGD